MYKNIVFDLPVLLVQLFLFIISLFAIYQMFIIEALQVRISFQCLRFLGFWMLVNIILFSSNYDASFFNLSIFFFLSYGQLQWKGVVAGLLMQNH